MKTKFLFLYLTFCLSCQSEVQNRGNHGNQREKALENAVFSQQEEKLIEDLKAENRKQLERAQMDFEQLLFRLQPHGHVHKLESSLKEIKGLTQELSEKTLKDYTSETMSGSMQEFSRIVLKLNHTMSEVNQQAHQFAIGALQLLKSVSAMEEASRLGNRASTGYKEAEADFKIKGEISKNNKENFVKSFEKLEQLDLSFKRGSKESEKRQRERLEEILGEIYLVSFEAIKLKFSEMEGNASGLVFQMKNMRARERNNLGKQQEEKGLFCRTIGWGCD